MLRVESLERASRDSLEIIADGLLDAVAEQSGTARQINRDVLVEALEKRFACARMQRARQQEPLVGLIQAAWGLEEEELEQLLAAPVGWLAAWRIHEAAMNDEQHSRLSALLSLHEALRLHVTPQRYSTWLRRRWRAEGFTRGRSPLDLLLSDGLEGIHRLSAYLCAEALA